MNGTPKWPVAPCGHGQVATVLLHRGSRGYVPRLRSASGSLELERSGDSRSSAPVHKDRPQRVDGADGRRRTGRVRRARRNRPLPPWARCTPRRRTVRTNPARSPAPAPGRRRWCIISWARSAEGTAPTSPSCTARIDSPGNPGSKRPASMPRRWCQESTITPPLPRPAARTISYAAARSGTPDCGKYSMWARRSWSAARSHNDANAEAASPSVSASPTRRPRTSSTVIERAPSEAAAATNSALLGAPVSPGSQSIRPSSSATAIPWSSMNVRRSRSLQPEERAARYSS